MSFKDDLGGLITNSDEQGRLFKALAQSVEDHGGSTIHLNRLLPDHCESAGLLDLIGRLIVGDIWDLVSRPISLDLTENDFDCDPREFCSRYPGIRGRAYMDFGRYKDTRPAGECRYALNHYRRPMLFDEICGDSFLSEYQERAGWRELLAYVSRLQPKNFSRCVIVAPGSPYKSESKEENKIFPVAESFGEEIRVSWLGVKRPETEKFGTRCFFLVRVY